mmetsp:Transcript_20942/g.59211  ORF Transcript_20942/g.59211 Transcript_20942/m.59211 type:complete len:135 (-) Transcript_20942:61-465(-)
MASEATGGGGGGGGSSVSSGRRAAAEAASVRSRPGAAAAPTEEWREWFRSVKENLEQFGDVDVFVDASAQDCACCMEPMKAPYRVRPRRCSHVFHVECLLQSWTEGTCPVCGASFAPEAPRPASSTRSSGAARA